MKLPALALLAVLTACSVSSSRVERAVITESGILEPAGTVTDQKATETAAGQVHMATEMRLVRPTDRIPRARGITFGYRFVVEGTPKGSPLGVTVTVLHPPIQRPGAAGAGEQDSWAQTVAIGSPSAAAWHFDEDWEMVPGKWTIKVKSGRQLLTERTFEVEAPAR